MAYLPNMGLFDGCVIWTDSLPAISAINLLLIIWWYVCYTSIETTFLPNQRASFSIPHQNSILNRSTAKSISTFHDPKTNAQQFLLLDHIFDTLGFHYTLLNNALLIGQILWRSLQKKICNFDRISNCHKVLKIWIMILFSFRFCVYWKINFTWHSYTPCLFQEITNMNVVIRFKFVHYPTKQKLVNFLGW